MASRRQLRVYYGPDDARSVALSQVNSAKSTVDLPLQVLLETLVDATRQKRAWIDDFREEQVTISTDLYEIIAAYQHLKRSA